MAADDLDKLYDLAIEKVGDSTEAELIRAIQQKKDNIELPKEAVSAEAEEDSSVSDANIGLEIAGMRIPEKIKLALYGNLIARRILIRDTSRQVPPFVLRNPRLSEGEVLEFVKNTNLDEMILRSIAGKAGWMKSYQMKLAVVSNPKMPLDVSLRWIKFIQDRDLRRLSKSKNIAQVVSSQCRKLLDKRTKSNREK